MIEFIKNNQILAKVRKLPIFHKHPTVKEMAKYSLVGNMSNLFDLGLYVSLTRFSSFWLAHYLSANIITMLVASVFRFTLHKKWTFRNNSDGVRKQYIKFILTMIFGLILTLVVIFMAVEWLHINDILAKILSMLIGTLIVYFITKHWVFDGGNNR